MINKTLLKFGFIHILTTVCSLSTVNAKQVCDAGQVINAAWSFNNTKVNTLRRDLTEPRNVGVSMDEMKRRIEARISIYHQGAQDTSVSRMAEIIANIAVCTGNDFTYLTAIFEQETSFCRDLGGANGSGCGQLTGVAIDEMKSQMRLPGQQRNNNANQEVTDYLNATVNSCASRLGDTDIATQFNDRYSQRTSDVLSGLRSGSNITTDMLMAALTLKFFTAKQGGYIVRGSAPGGLSAYNGGGTPGYASEVNSTAQNINVNCYEDNFTPSIQQRACFLGSTPSNCATATANDGSVAI